MFSPHYLASGKPVLYSNIYYTQQKEMHKKMTCENCSVSYSMI